ncbi:MAG: L-seryl-tRNA(Sec) selenium transferase [Bacteroidales bacterium]|nr:L-seryl-tRNA(Sec) selenium transferase [Bacteroidales bacterium]
MKQNSIELKNLPAVDKLLCAPEIKTLISENNPELVKYSIKNVLDFYRKIAKVKGIVSPLPVIIDRIKSETEKFGKKSLRPVINATGIIIHTNLGRAPFGEDIINEVSKVLTGYNNLEFDLENAKRGTRYSHISGLLKYLTGAEDVLIVNNNAAAVMLSLRAFAKNKDVIISRGELIEIGGSFRLPEILKASDCKMIEVGTTNKTSVQDYENAINENTAILLKAHKSNYIIKGFTKEASLQELVKLGEKYNIPVIYDIGSGLLRKTPIDILKDEPDVRQTLAAGVDLVCFSGDKLLGGPQAGIIAGKKELIAHLKTEPMLRALRVGKTTLALLESVCLNYLDDKRLFEKNMLFRMLKKTPDELKKNALILQKELKQYNIEAKVVENKGQCGGGTLPGKEIDSWSVLIEKKFEFNKKKSEFSEKMFYNLLNYKFPILGILKKGRLYFDMLTIPEKEIIKVAKIISEVYKSVSLQ